MGFFDWLAPEGKGTERVPTSALPGAGVAAGVPDTLSRLLQMLAPQGQNGGDPSQWKGDPSKTSGGQGAVIVKPTAEIRKQDTQTPPLRPRGVTDIAKMGAQRPLPSSSQINNIDDWIPSQNIMQERANPNQALSDEGALRTQNDPTAGGDSQTPQEAKAKNPYHVVRDPFNGKGFDPSWTDVIIALLGGPQMMMLANAGKFQQHKEHMRTQELADQWEGQQRSEQQKVDTRVSDFAQEEAVRNFYHNQEATDQYNMEAPERKQQQAIAALMAGLAVQREGRTGQDQQIDRAEKLYNMMQPKPAAALNQAMGVKEDPRAPQLLTGLLKSLGIEAPQPSFEEQKLNEALELWNSTHGGITPNAVNMNWALGELARRETDPAKRKPLLELASKVFKQSTQQR